MTFYTIARKMEEEHDLMDLDPEYSSSEDDSPKLHGRSERSSKWTNVSFNVGVLLIAITFVVVSFAAGLLIGMKALDGRDSSTPSPPPVTSGFNWGASVKVGGTEMPVVDWLDENMDATNIKRNLL